MVFAVKPLAGTANSSFHLGFYSDICFLSRSWYSRFVFSQIIEIFCYSFRPRCSKTHCGDPEVFWAFWRVSLGSLLFSVGLGTLFHCFDKCPNHEDLLEHLIVQSAPKLVLVTLAPFGPFAGLSL